MDHGRGASKWCECALLPLVKGAISGPPPPPPPYDAAAGRHRRSACAIKSFPLCLRLPRPFLLSSSRARRCFPAPRRALPRQRPRFFSTANGAFFCSPMLAAPEIHRRRNVFSATALVPCAPYFTCTLVASWREPAAHAGAQTVPHDLRTTPTMLHR